MTAAKINVLDRIITVSSYNEADYICITDIAKYKNSATTDDLIRNWLRNRNTIEFLGIWEQLNNPGFNPVEFDGIRIQAGQRLHADTDDTRIIKLDGGER